MDRSGWAPLCHAGLGLIWMASFGTLFYWLAIEDSPLLYGAIVASVAYLAREMTRHEKRAEGGLAAPDPDLGVGSKEPA